MRVLVPVLWCFASLSWCASLPCEAQEWTRFRGPNGTGVGHAASIPVSWTENDYLWRTKLPGVGHSSPVIWGNRLFLTSGSAETSEQIVLCVDTRNGKLLWTRRFPASPHPMHAIHQQNSYASSSPVVDAHRVYVTWGTPEKYVVRALDHQGQDVWDVDLGPFQAQHGFGCSPILYDDMLIVPNDHQGGGFIVSLDCATGKQRWRKWRGVDIAAYSTPCVYHPPGKTPLVIFTSTADGLTAVEPATGETVWQLGQVLPQRCVGSPLVVGDLVLACCGSGGNGKVAIAAHAEAERAGEAPEDRIAYRITQSVPYVPTPVAHAGLVFLWHDKGVVTCANAETGKPLWRKRVGGGFSSSPICVSGRLYCVSQDGEVVVLAAAKEFKELGRSQLGTLVRATPAVSGGKMFLRTDSELLCVGGKQ